MSATPATGNRVINRGFCQKCGTVCPVERERRGNHLYLVRECPRCGHDETLISRDAELYYEKRDMMGYVGEAQATCSLMCADCKLHASPKFVILDVTNRCNMNCPICLANIPAMGYEFHPPLGYFEKIFDHLLTLKPVPKVQLFGGEPTCREDLVELLQLATKRGIFVRMVTNGLKFADEEYCKAVLGTKPQLLLGLDGLDPDIQKKLRKNPHSLDKKLKAIDNIEKHSKSKICLMCTTAVGVSDKLLPGLLEYCYTKRNIINRMMLIPLQSTAGPELVGEQSSTIEDVEHMMADIYPGVEFIPVGALRAMESAMEFYGENMTMGGAHPNCECLALLVAEPRTGTYRPVNEYLKKPYKQTVREMMEWDKQVTRKLKRSLLVRLFGNGMKRTLYTVHLARWVLRNVRMDQAVGPKPVRTILKAVWDKVTSGKRWKEVVKKHLGDRSMFQLIILPYEEQGCLESARLVDCPVAFGCEHPVTGNVTLIPFCSYFVYKNDILRKSTERWGIQRGNQVLGGSDVAPDAPPEAVAKG